MVDWNRARALADKMINAYGRPITLINETGPEDPTDPLGPSDDRIEIKNVMGVFVRPSGYIKLGESYYMGPGMWEEAEKIVLVTASLQHNYAKFTRVQDSDGTDLKIFKVEELAPGPVPILVYLGLKQ